MRVKRKVKRTKLSALQERIQKRQLAEEDWAVLEGMTKTLEALSLAIEEKDASLGRLAKHLLGAPTETQRNVLRKERPEHPERTARKAEAQRAWPKRGGLLYRRRPSHPGPSQLESGGPLSGCRAGKTL